MLQRLQSQKRIHLQHLEFRVKSKGRQKRDRTAQRKINYRCMKHPWTRLKGNFLSCNNIPTSTSQSHCLITRSLLKIYAKVLRLILLKYDTIFESFEIYNQLCLEFSQIPQNLYAQKDEFPLSIAVLNKIVIGLERCSRDPLPQTFYAYASWKCDP